MSRLYKDKKGVTLIELLVATFLLSLVFMAVSALHVSSQKLFFAQNDKVTISYELQYAMEHIYRKVMKGIGDKTSTVIQVVSGGEGVDINMDTRDPDINGSLSEENYGDLDEIVSYYKSGNELIYDNGSSTESLVPTITVTAVNFQLKGNLLTVTLSGSYRNESLSFYSACYPHLATFN